MSEKNNHFVIILAAGKGKRMQINDLKQFLILGDKPVVMHSISKFHEFDSNSIVSVVLPKNKIKYWKELCSIYNFKIPHYIFIGGGSRYHSVKNALTNLKINPNDIVSIHDGVRPFISKNLIKKLFHSTIKKGHSAPFIKSKDSIRMILNKNKKTQSVNRSDFVFIQTPQIFRGSIILNAYTKNIDNKTDDISLIEDTVDIVNLIAGQEENIKITTKKEWRIAQGLIKNKEA